MTNSMLKQPQAKKVRASHPVIDLLDLCDNNWCALKESQRRERWMC